MDQRVYEHARRLGAAHINGRPARGTSTIAALHSLPNLPTAVQVQAFDLTSSSWDAPVDIAPESTLSSFLNSPQTTWFINAGIPHIRFVSLQNKSGIRVLVSF